MGEISKAMLRTTVGLAVGAALVVGGAGVASAAPARPAAHTASPAAPRCDDHARERWDLSGRYHLEAVYQGSTFTYDVTFRQSGSCLDGFLRDPYYPTMGPVVGTVDENFVVFSFQYPRHSIQGTRSYVGTINRRGEVSGIWTETGRERGSGRFYLARSRSMH